MKTTNRKHSVPDTSRTYQDLISTSVALDQIALEPCARAPAVPLPRDEIGKLFRAFVGAVSRQHRDDVVFMYAA